MSVFAVETRTGVRSALERIVSFYSSRIDPSRGILLKPNIVFPVRDSSGQITRRRVTGELIHILKEAYQGISIVIGEGTAAGSIPGENFHASGYDRLAQSLDIPLVDLHKADRVPVAWKYGTVELPRIVLESTYISLPILKESSAAGISGALKNQKGILAAGMMKKFHMLGLDDPLAHLNAVVQPNLTIMDCSAALEKGVFLAGDNCGEIDETACRWLAMEEPDHVRLSREAGVFRSGFTVGGDRVGSAAVPRFPPRQPFTSVGRVRLWSSPRTCSMCRRLFHDLGKVPTSVDALVAGMKMLPFFFRGVEVLAGASPPNLPKGARVICVGECTRKVAKDKGYVHVPGCPPTIRNLRQCL